MLVRKEEMLQMGTANYQAKNESTPPNPPKKHKDITPLELLVKLLEIDDD